MIAAILHSGKTGAGLSWPSAPYFNCTDLAHAQCVESENQNQREKLEGELKKEIKKLQRLREQIKGW